MALSRTGSRPATGFDKGGMFLLLQSAIADGLAVATVAVSRGLTLGGFTTPALVLMCVVGIGLCYGPVKAVITVSNRPRVAGTGSGLASARQMPRSQSGGILVTNRAEGGVAPHFSLPTGSDVCL